MRAALSSIVAVWLGLGMALALPAGAVAQTKPSAKVQKVQTAKPQAQALTPAPAPAVPSVPPPPAAPELVRSLGGISEYKLANGLQILLFPDDSKPTMTVNLTYKVGSRHEGAGETGMAHLLEHMLFKGTPEYTDIPAEFSKRGMRFNGTTTTDRTNYFSNFNASDETLAFALKLEANRMLRSTILRADLDKEMPVVRNELEIGENSPGQLLRQRVVSMAFRFHPYGRPTIGTRSDVENVAIPQLQAFYRQYYQPDNAVLIVAGQIDPARTLALIAQEFGPLPRPGRVLTPDYTVEPPQDGDRSLSLRRVGGGPLIMAVYHVPAMANPDCAPLGVLGLLLAQPPSGSLYKTLVETKKATHVFAGGCGGYDPGVFTVGASLPPGVDGREVERTLLDEAEGRVRAEFKPEDVQRIAAQFELSYRQVLKSPDNAVGLLSEAVAGGDWRLIFKLLENVRRVTVADVNRVARQYLQPANRSIGRYQPVNAAEKVEIPLTPDRTAGLELLKMDQQMSAGESFDPTPTALQARTTRQTLASGIQLALLPKKTRGDTVVLSMRLRWADARTVVNAIEAGWVAPLLFEGTNRHSRQTLQDESIKLKGGFNIQGDGQGASISMQAERDTLLPMLALLREVLREPLLPPEPFELMRGQALAGLQGDSKEPETLRSEAIRVHYNTELGLKPGDPGYRFSREQQQVRIRAVTLAQVREFYQHYWSANQLSVAVVGDLPPGLDVAIEALFGNWKKPGAPAFVRHTDPFKAVAPARFDVQASDKANAVIRLRQEIKLSSQSDDYVALSLANHMLGGGGLESRLPKRVRGQEGLSYGIGSELHADFWDDSGYWSIGGNFAPENRDRLLAAVQDEIRMLLAEGFTQAELDRARNDVLQGRRQQRSNDAGLANNLLYLMDTGEDWLSNAERGDQRRREVTLDQINDALRRSLKPDAWVISTAGDFAAKPQASTVPTDKVKP
ncbi:pitrilysin family protein [soil metagenome]